MATNLDRLAEAELVDPDALSDFEKEVVEQMSTEEVDVLIELKARNSEEKLGQEITSMAVPL